MGQAEAQSIYTSVFDRLNALVGSSGHLHGPAPFERARFERDIAQVEKTEAAHAFLLRAVLAQLDGDIDAVETNVAAARRLHASNAEHFLADAYANLGFASRALAHLREVMRGGAADLSALFSSAVNSGSAETVLRAVDEADRAGQKLSSRANELIDCARKVSAALISTGHTEDELASVIDVAGEVMRENKLLWLDKMPTILTDARGESDDTAPGVHYYFRVDVSPSEGASLSGDIGWRLVDRDLVFPAITAALIGVKHDDTVMA